MKQRIISAILGVIVFAAVLLLGETAFDIAVLIISEIAIAEIMTALGEQNNRATRFVTALFPVAVLEDACLTCGAHKGELAFLYLAILMLLMLFDGKRISFDTVCKFFTVALYISIAFSYVTLTRHTENGLANVMLIFIGCWITDTCAYFFGLTFGKHKLAPVISPKKTIEGSVGGVLGVTAITVAYAALCANIIDCKADFLNAAIIGATCGVLSQLGDLCASVIKREHNIKDYGHIMPGHGGVMDRFDSIIFVAPAVYYLIKILPVFI